MALIGHAGAVTPKGVVDIVLRRYESAARERRRLANLLFAVDAVLAVTVAAFIAFAFVRSGDGDSVKTVATGLAAVAEGGLLAFLSRRRREAVAEEVDAYREVREFYAEPSNRAAFERHAGDLGTPAAAPDKVRKRRWGRWTLIAVAFMLVLAMLGSTGPSCVWNPYTQSWYCG